MAFSIAVDRPNEKAIELTPVADSVRFSTAAIGGFGSASFQLSVNDAKRVPHLARVRIFHGTRMLWEGRVEDKQLTISQGDAQVSLSCFGFSRLLEEASVRRIWLMRSIAWRPALQVSGLVNCGGVSSMTLHPDTLFATVGQIDVGDLTRVGVAFAHNQGAAPGADDCMWAVYIAPQGMTLVKSIMTISGSPGGGGVRVYVQDSIDTVSGGGGSTLGGSSGGGGFSTWNSLLCQAPAVLPQPETTITHTLGARAMLVGTKNGTTANPQTFEGIRILGTSLNEDTPGAFYGGTILRDLLRFVPGLSVGIIDNGTEFALQSIARLVRDSAMSIVQEVSAYYDREWTVWEDRKFNWTAVNADAPDWVIPISLIQDLELTSSVDGLTKTTYLIYQNAVTGETEERTATSNDYANPYARSGDQLDTLVQAPAVMTGLSGSRLASKIVTDRGGAPMARGRLTIPALQDLRNVNSGPAPAMFVRAGDNVIIPDAPTDNYFRPTGGADGATLFHIRSTEVDMQSGMVSLELDAFTHRSDILMARIGAVTRVFTGG